LRLAARRLFDETTDPREREVHARHERRRDREHDEPSADERNDGVPRDRIERGRMNRDATERWATSEHATLALGEPRVLIDAHVLGLPTLGLSWRRAILEPLSGDPHERKMAAGVHARR
jgi:hypothetical protein